MDEKEIISKYHSKLGKLSHKKHPRDPKYFKRIQALSVKKRKENQLKRMPIPWRQIKYNEKMTRILMVPHGGSKNDTICTVEVKKFVATG